MDDLFLALQQALAGEYSIERELGRGGMGIVYLAREVRLAREVALKVLPPAFAASPEMRGRFLREAQIAARLSHPNIVPIHRVDEAGGFVYFVMAYVKGETLAQRVRSRGPLPPHQAARVLREVAWALTYAHSNGIVHRDVKAENILLEDGTDRALVTDFGIAGAIQGDARDADGFVAGSAHYASPEQIAGQPLDAASDLYSLGVTGFLALTGRLPFDAPTTRELVAMQLNARPPAVTSLAPTVPAKLSQVVERSLAKRPEHRFPSAAAFAEVIDQAVEQPREIPAALRVWLNRTNQMARFQIVLGIYLTAGVAMPLAVATHSALWPITIAVGTVTAIVALPSFLRMRRVLEAGYGIEDLRVAIREHWIRKREEEFYELTGGQRRLSKRSRWALFAGSAATAVGLGIVAAARPISGPLLPILMTMASVFAVGTGVLALSEYTRLKRLPKMGRGQIKRYDSKWGERFVKLCGLGMKTKQTASSLPQLTEVALGRATDALYDALPKDLRKQLKNLPSTVRRLEDDAKSMRTEIDRLDGIIGQLDGDARVTLPSAVVDSEHEDGIRTERDRLRGDLRHLREQADARLASTVAALENIRLDLLRLQLGDGNVSSVTASLEAAQSAAADLGLYVEATREVDASLSGKK